eukprot:TRINITY_DN15849_c0_g1_i3.p1 TRINITY_DN15849_c0_g1~~TRINITY_DN15849_c0_g1_i3.p1  ORF type:complete len:619 (+),score=137.49 TRINITY_DN15849_c0_g1_i3:1723-3579(+)
MDSVEDWLIFSGKCYEEHKDKLRANQIKEEVSHLRDKPQITELAQELGRGGVPVEVRLSTPRKSPPPPDVAAAYSFSPVINEESKTATARYSSSMWRQKRDSNIKNLREQQQASELSSLQKPQTNTKYDETTKHRTKGLVLHDHLYKSDTNKRNRLFSRYEEVHHSEMQEKPRISKYAPSEKDLRILQDYKERREAKKQEAEIAARNSRKPATASKEPFFERFLSEHQEKTRTKENLAQERETEIKRKAGQKHISTYSEMLIKKSKQRKDYKRTPKPPPRNPEEDEIRPGKVITEHEIKQLHERFNKYSTKKEHELSKIRRELENEEARECTFNPFNAPAVQSSNTSEMFSSRKRSGSLRDRNMQWLSRREERLSAMKQGIDKEEIEICTFRPYVNQEIPKNVVDTQTLHGYDEYVIRMKKSRMQKEEEELRKSNAFRTKKWTGRNTVPVGPRLGLSRRSSISSLNRPVEAPTHAIPDRQATYDYKDVQEYNIRLQEYYASPEYAEWWYANRQYFEGYQPVSSSTYRLEREVSDSERPASYHSSNRYLEREVSEVSGSRSHPLSDAAHHVDPYSNPSLPGGPGGGGSSVRSDPVYAASDEVPNNYLPDSPYDDSLEPV